MVKNIFDTRKLLIIHASAVLINGEALLFLGKSGTGKSTVCQLLRPYATQIADDWVYLMPCDDNRWRMASADARKFYTLSEQQLANLVLTPVNTILSLSQAKEFALARLNDMTVCRCLVNAFYEVWPNINADRNLGRAVFPWIASLARMVPGYELSFTRSKNLFSFLVKEIDMAFD
ncbi:MAG TPA: hypothetical protein PKZ84_01710 [Anaerolineae bacterium]|nr:hypothetical protein [Anaerolineae bacterium]HQI83115.1 hypothetical protein [Anaerolineae bacterium]